MHIQPRPGLQCCHSLSTLRPLTHPCPLCNIHLLRRSHSSHNASSSSQDRCCAQEQSSSGRTTGLSSTEVQQSRKDHKQGLKSCLAIHLSKGRIALKNKAPLVDLSSAQHLTLILSAKQLNKAPAMSRDVAVAKS